MQPSDGLVVIGIQAHVAAQAGIAATEQSGGNGQLAATREAQPERTDLFSNHVPPTSWFFSLREGCEQVSGRCGRERIGVKERATHKMSRSTFLSRWSMRMPAMMPENPAPTDCARGQASQRESARKGIFRAGEDSEPEGWGGVGRRGRVTHSWPPLAFAHCALPGGPRA